MNDNVKYQYINTIYQYNFADDNINSVTVRCHDIYDIHDIWSVRV